MSYQLSANSTAISGKHSSIYKMDAPLHYICALNSEAERHLSSRVNIARTMLWYTMFGYSAIYNFRT